MHPLVTGLFLARGLRDDATPVKLAVGLRERTRAWRTAASRPTPRSRPPSRSCRDGSGRTTRCRRRSISKASRRRWRSRARWASWPTAPITIRTSSSSSTKSRSRPSATIRAESLIATCGSPGRSKQPPRTRWPRLRPWRRAAGTCWRTTHCSRNARCRRTAPADRADSIATRRRRRCASCTCPRVLPWKAKTSARGRRTCASPLGGFGRSWRAAHTGRRRGVRRNRRVRRRSGGWRRKSARPGRSRCGGDTASRQHISYTARGKPQRRRLLCGGGLSEHARSGWREPVRAPLAKLPFQSMRRHAADPDPPLVHPVQVMRGAQADEVRGVVAAARRAELHVVDVSRRPTAAWHLAESPIARQDPPLRCALLLQRRFPRVDEVLCDPPEALARRNPFPRRLAGRRECHCEQRRHPARRAKIEITPRAHLPLLVPLELAPQLDAGHRLRDAGELVYRGVVRLPGDEPRLLVRDAPFAHRPPQLREHLQPVLERDALLDGALGHAHPLAAAVAEGGESRLAPEAQHLHQHREVAEHLVPLRALAREPAQLRIEEQGVRLGHRPGHGGEHRIHPVEERPLHGLLLQPFLERVEGLLDWSPQDASPGDLIGRAMRTDVLLANHLDALPLGRSVAEDLSREFHRLVHDGPCLRRYREGHTLPRLVLVVFGAGGRFDRGLQSALGLAAACSRRP